MLDSVIVQMKASEQNTDAGECRKSPRADLIKLRDCVSRVFHVSSFQIRLGQQIQILQVDLDASYFIGQLCQVELTTRAGGKIGAIIEIVEQFSKGRGPLAEILRQGLERIQVAIRGCSFVQAALGHG